MILYTKVLVKNPCKILHKRLRKSPPNRQKNGQNNHPPKYEKNDEKMNECGTQSMGTRNSAEPAKSFVKMQGIPAFCDFIIDDFRYFVILFQASNL